MCLSDRFSGKIRSRGFSKAKFLVTNEQELFANELSKVQRSFVHNNIFFFLLEKSKRIERDEKNPLNERKKKIENVIVG